jgi:FtsZ-binding cell division protein ZapB
MSVSVRLVAFVTFALIMFACRHAAQASQEAGDRDPCAASRQVSVNPPAGSDAGPQSVDALDVIRALSKQNDELKDKNTQLQDVVKKATGERARETKDLEEKLEQLEQGRDSGGEGRGRPSWGAVAFLVTLAFAIGMTVARRKDTERGE